MFWCWKQVHLVVRQVQAQESKITWDFLLVSQAKSWQPEHTFRHKSSARICLLPRPRDSSVITNRTSSKLRMELEFLHVPFVIATGAEYRRPPLKNLSRFEGAGVYYGATFVEAQLCGGEEVIVVGGGNSAGQAAVFLAQTAKRVHMLVRSAGLADNMSRYLIRRIENSPTIVLRP